MGRPRNNENKTSRRRAAMTGALVVTFSLGIVMIMGAGSDAGSDAVDGWSLRAGSGGLASVPPAISPNLKRVELTPLVEAASRKGGWVIDARIEQAWDLAIVDLDQSDAPVKAPPMKPAPPVERALEQPAVAAKVSQPQMDAKAEQAMATLRVVPRSTDDVDLGLGVRMVTPSDSGKPARHEPFRGWGDYDATGATGVRSSDKEGAVDLPRYTATSCLPAYPAPRFDAIALFTSL